MQSHEPISASGAAQLPASASEADVKIVVQAVALFMAPFESLLRQLNPPLTLGHLVALDIIAHASSIRPFQLGERMAISRQLAWQTCKRLETLGLVSIDERKPPEKGVAVTPTELGMSCLMDASAIYLSLAESLNQRHQLSNASRLKATLRCLAEGAAAMSLAEQQNGSIAKASMT